MVVVVLAMNAHQGGPGCVAEVDLVVVVPFTHVGREVDGRTSAILYDELVRVGEVVTVFIRGNVGRPDVSP